MSIPNVLESYKNIIRKIIILLLIFRGVITHKNLNQSSTKVRQKLIKSLSEIKSQQFNQKPVFIDIHKK